MPDGQDPILARMYQYSRAIYRSIKNLIDPYADGETQLEYRREALAAWIVADQLMSFAEQG